MDFLLLVKANGGLNQLDALIRSSLTYSLNLKPLPHSRGPYINHYSLLTRSIPSNYVNNKMSLSN